MDPEPLPNWLLFQGQNPVLRSVLEDLWQNPDFRQRITESFAPEGQFPFVLRVGGRDFLDQFNAGRRDGVKIDRNTGAASLYNADAGRVDQGGFVVDVDRIHDATRARRGAPVDSAQARGLIRDALVHEFAHMAPVAQARSMDARLFDPKPRDRDLAQSPIIRGENKLRGLLGLEPKTYYGLLDR